MGFKKSGRKATIVGIDDGLYSEAATLLSKLFDVSHPREELQLTDLLYPAFRGNYEPIIQHIRTIGGQMGTRPEVITGVCNIIRYGDSGLSWDPDASAGFNLGRFYERYSLVMANEHATAASIARDLGRDAPVWWIIK